MFRIILALVMTAAGCLAINSIVTAASPAVALSQCKHCVLVYDPITQQRRWLCIDTTEGAQDCLLTVGGASCTNLGVCPP